MNNVTLMGRLSRDPEVRYSQSANPIAVANYNLAVRREFAKEGQVQADFINVVAFGKAAEFVQKHFRKGHMIAIEGRIQVDVVDKDNVKTTYVKVVAEKQHFTGAKHSSTIKGDDAQGIGVSAPQEEYDELPF